MANILGPITMVILLLAGFVAYKNKQAYEVEITNTRTERDNLDRSQKRLKTAQTNLADTIAKREGVEADNVKLTADEANQTKANKEFESQIAVKTRETESNKKQLDEIREKVAKIGDLRELATKMKATKAELDELGQNIASLDTKLDGLTNSNKDTENRIGSMQKMFDTIAASSSLPTLKTSIRSIFPTWGFVTLGAGNDAGVVMNSTLDVVRDGATIAKLVVTTVERNTASANIVPDSIADDVTLMVGDRVVPAAAEGKPAPGPTAFAN